MAKNLNGEKKLVSNVEFSGYMLMTFFVSNLVNVIGNSTRQKYLANLGIDGETVALINTICNVISLVLPFFFAMIVDRAPKPGKSKFIPLVTLTAVPTAVFSVLMFYTPARLLESDVPFVLMITYQCVVTVLFNSAVFFANTYEKIAMVISPNHAERDSVLSYRAICSAVGSAAPLLWIMLLGLLKKPGLLKGDNAVYLATSVFCAVLGAAAMLLSARVVKERVPYSSKPVNPLKGYADVLKNPYALLLLLSEFLKNFRSISSYMSPFIAAVLLGDSTKYLVLGLPTALGTMTGMLVVKTLLKKMTSKTIYMCSGVYSIAANIAAFGVGMRFLRNPGNMGLQVVFIALLYLIGLQFGASNLLPQMFKADILEDLEMKTHKRLEASLDFVTSMGSSVSGLVANALGPIFLFGASALNFIHYVQPVNHIEQPQTERTKILILLLYTMGQGVFMLLCNVPLLFYKLTGARKRQVHNEVLAYRAQLETQSVTAQTRV
ncbi:MAG: MFS transporter [Oscillospiraceae bacterium]|jgi:Na+/melibiose symporter-like transporter|nr:MFS transporter [Oscillospiraceae bacterium]